MREKGRKERVGERMNQRGRNDWEEMDEREREERIREERDEREGKGREGGKDGSKLEMVRGKVHDNGLEVAKNPK